jgi:methionine-rich copper-binding protein CopC
MFTRPAFRRPARRRRRRDRLPAVEALESRSLPSAASWPGLIAPRAAPAGASTLAQAFDLGAIVPFSGPFGPGLSANRAEAVGTLGAGPANVEWFSFLLKSAADVTLTTPRGLGADLLTPVLTLYNSAVDPANPGQGDPNDPYDPTGHRLLAQDDGAGHGGVATLEQVLAPGTYYVAVSGSGDHDFSPLIAGSGEPGDTGNYGLLVSAAQLAAPVSGPGPTVIAATPADGAALNDSPLALRLALSGPLDPNTLLPGQTVLLTDGDGNPVAINNVVFNTWANELQVFPAALAPGTYHLTLVGDGAAHSGAPVIAAPDGSSLGSTPARPLGQDYALTFRVTGVDGIPGASGAGAAISTTRVAVRLAVAAPLEPATIRPDVTVLLTDANGNPVPIGSAVFDDNAGQLDVYPAAPLGPGTYHLTLVGQDPTQSGQPVIMDRTGQALGSITPGGMGQNYTLTWTVTDIGGVLVSSAPDDTLSTAHELGDVTSSGLVQVHGAVGDDPFAAAPGADVDLYHFRVSGSGHFALVAGADAGRIGSPLQPALALFRLDGGQLTLVGADGGTGNQTTAPDGSTPLATDSVLYAALTAGDYYLAVGGKFNLPDPTLGTPYPPDPTLGPTGVYDPRQSESGQIGIWSGDYLLSLALHQDNVAPHVTAVDGLPSSTQGMPTTFITVHFDKAMNLRQLAYQQEGFDALNGLPAPSGTVSAVWVVGSDGQTYYPRLLSYDDATNVATFYMLDALPAGLSHLHLAGVLPDGSPGLTDLAGNLLADSVGGDWVREFTVSGPARVTVTDPLAPHVNQVLTWQSHWYPGGLSVDSSGVQTIGPVFPDELQNGVDVLGHLTPAPPSGSGADVVDSYEIEVLQDREYALTLTDELHPGTGRYPTPTNAQVRVFSLDGTEQPGGSGPFIWVFDLKPGKYIVQVGPLDPSRARDLDYRLRITLPTSYENAVALTDGAAPAYAIAVRRSGPPAAPPPVTPPPTLTLPSAPETGVVPATNVTTSSALSAVTSALSLPSGTLSGLSAAPVGGVRDGDAPQAPAAVAQLALPSPSATTASVRLASEGAEPDGEAPAGVVSRLLRALGQMGGASVDRAFADAVVARWLTSWLRGFWLPFASPIVPPSDAEPDTAPGDGDDAPQDETPDAPDEAALRPVEAADVLWASGLLLAGGIAAEPLARQGRTKGADRRRSRLGGNRGGDEDAA